jgi:hypothetical protein
VLITTRDIRLLGQMGGVGLTVLDEASAVGLLMAMKTQLLRSSLVTQGEKHKELRIHGLVQA